MLGGIIELVDDDEKDTQSVDFSEGAYNNIRFVVGG
jgi:hypothetical protein